MMTKEMLELFAIEQISNKNTKLRYDEIEKKKEIKIEHSLLVGKTKNEILDLLGDEFNFYPENVWYYVLSRNWYGRKKVLYLEFEDDIVTRKSIRFVNGKI